jgi:hypothetical protein
LLLDAWRAALELIYVGIQIVSSFAQAQIEVAWQILCWFVGGITRAGVRAFELVFFDWILACARTWKSLVLGEAIVWYKVRKRMEVTVLELRLEGLVCMGLC